MKRAAELIAEGLSDQKIADALGLGGNAGRMLVSRHRRFHVLAPAAAIAKAASKGRANVDPRQELIAAADDLVGRELALNDPDFRRRVGLV
jgi:hypothetical protein